MMAAAVISSTQYVRFSQGATSGETVCAMIIPVMNRSESPGRKEPRKQSCFCENNEHYNIEATMGHDPFRVGEVVKQVQQ